MKYILSLMLGCFIAFGSSFPVCADVGPKPSMAVTLPDNLPADVVDGILLQCKESDCSDAKPLERLGPQNFGCSTNSCSGMAYGFSNYMQIVLRLKDSSSLVSNVFSKKAFRASFKVEYDGEKLSVQEE